MSELEAGEPGPPGDSSEREAGSPPAGVGLEAVQELAAGGADGAAAGASPQASGSQGSSPDNEGNAEPPPLPPNGAPVGGDGSLSATQLGEATPRLEAPEAASSCADQGLPAEIPAGGGSDALSTQVAGGSPEPEAAPADGGEGSAREQAGAQAEPTGVPEEAADEPPARPPHRAYFVDGLRAINVEVDCGPGAPCQLLQVTIDVSAAQGAPKPYLGGYRHKGSGALFHHAATETAGAVLRVRKGALGGGRSPAAEAGGGPAELLTRQTQTVKAASTSCQTVREAATQVARPGLEQDRSNDRVVVARPYTDSAAVGERRAAAALTIQRWCRGWLARRAAAELRALKKESDCSLARAAAEREAAAQERRRREVERRTHPLCRSDFDLLARELEGWRRQQTATIRAVAAKAGQQERAGGSAPGGAGPAGGFDEHEALQLLLSKETRLLRALDRLRTTARRELKARDADRLLGSLSEPKTWALSGGRQALVHTPGTVRAAELQQLHRGLSLPSLTLDERLDVLLHAKWAASAFDHADARELAALIDREADLLNRGRSPATLGGLRQRIAGLFLALCQQPAFNPEARRLALLPAGAPEQQEAAAAAAR